MPGTLLIVGTPLGNLSDMPPRAIDALKSADLILCEDTRHTRKLLTHFGIDRPTDSYHEHNEDEKAAGLVDRVERGETLALVSDAGMPVISDPGYRIVRIARERGLRVEPIPGPFAGVLALAASGLPPLPFTLVFAAPAREAEAVSTETLREEFERLRESGMRRNDAVKAVAEKFGMRKNDVYRLLAG